MSLYWKHRGDRIVPRVQVAELAKKLQAGPTGTILLGDVRSHGYYGTNVYRIPGAIRIEPNNLNCRNRKAPQAGQYLFVLHLPQ